MVSKGTRFTLPPVISRENPSHDGVTTSINASVTWGASASDTAKDSRSAYSSTNNLDVSSNFWLIFGFEIFQRRDYEKFLYVLNIVLQVF